MRESMKMVYVKFLKHKQIIYKYEIYQYFGKEFVAIEFNGFGVWPYRVSIEVI